jgi:hypothetical protein
MIEELEAEDQVEHLPSAADQRSSPQWSHVQPSAAGLTHALQEDEGRTNNESQPSLPARHARESSPSMTRRSKGTSLPVCGFASSYLAHLGMESVRTHCLSLWTR